MFRECQHEIAAVILDLTMPVLDGEQTFHQLRQIRPDVKVILSSGYTSLEVSRRFSKGGLAGYLKKPFDTDELSCCSPRCSTVTSTTRLLTSVLTRESRHRCRVGARPMRTRL